MASVSTACRTFARLLTLTCSNIDALPQTMAHMLKQIHDATGGWTGTMLLTGCDPRSGGDLKIFM